MDHCLGVSASPTAPRDLTGHVIVCGLKALGLRIVEVLRSSAVPVVVVDDDPDRRLLPILERWEVPYIEEMPRLPEVLVSAGLDGARAVVSVESDDLQNLETALVVRTGNARMCGSSCRCPMPPCEPPSAVWWRPVRPSTWPLWPHRR